MTFYFLVSTFIHLGIALSTSLFENPKVQTEPINFVEIHSEPVTTETTKVATQTPRPQKAAKPKAQKAKSKKLITQKDKSPVVVPVANVEGAPLPEKKNVAAVNKTENLKPLSQDENAPEKVVVASPAQPPAVEKPILQNENPSKAVAGESSGLTKNVTDARTLKQKAGNIGPAYPLKDRLQRNTGEVVVMGYLNKNGFIEGAKVLKSSGSREMQNNSLKAFSGYRFVEGQQGWVKMPFQFILSGQAETISTRNRSAVESLLTK